jgi:hypothetical protein
LLKDAALSLGVARGFAGNGQAVQGAQEEGPRAHRWVEHCYPVEHAGCGRILPDQTALGFLLAWLVADNYRAAALLFGAALGAYVGSFLGTMNRVRGGRRSEASIQHPVEPKGGRMIAVKADRPGADQRALKVLRELGARDVGRAEGDWRDGWKDFDPRAPLMAP